MAGQQLPFQVAAADRTRKEMSGGARLCGNYPAQKLFPLRTKSSGRLTVTLMAKGGGLS